MGSLNKSQEQTQFINRWNVDILPKVCVSFKLSVLKTSYNMRNVSFNFMT